MSGIRINIENDKIRGDMAIWAGVAGGIIVAGLAMAVLNHIRDEDGNSNTHKPEELTEVVFSPKNSTDTECRGLAIGKEIIDSTIVCTYNK